MSSEERRKILQMVADGKISAEEAATLMRTLDDDSAEEEIQIIEAESGSWSERPEAPEFEEVRRRASRFSRGFLGLGILFTVLSAWIMFSIQQNAGLNFWFFCFAMPLVLGIVFITLGAGSQTSRWLYVNVDRSQAVIGRNEFRSPFRFHLDWQAGSSKISDATLTDLRKPILMK